MSAILESHSLPQFSVKEFLTSLRLAENRDSLFPAVTMSLRPSLTLLSRKHVSVIYYTRVRTSPERQFGGISPRQIHLAELISSSPVSGYVAKCRRGEETVDLPGKMTSFEFGLEYTTPTQFGAQGDSN